ncbi:uncharacterized protein LOC126431349 [Schistocerca serialis cubense]|uniref:uncharacterized protein LOC126431349 n=1 Tax=Schistocerca serialis cubense TaxID=2023355 RepID=UPI00214F2CA0|nr:uncharacterized protein LOC126431349 [Schistocerca serialis cubense]
MPENAVELLLKIYNGILMHQEQIIVTIFIIPTALSASNAKILEKLIKRLLEWWVESSYLMLDHNLASVRSSTDNISALVSSVLADFGESKYTVALFLVIAKECDNIHTSILLDKLILLGISPKKNTGFKGPCLMDNSIPQRSVLSSLLYATYAYDMGRAITQPVRIIHFADEISLCGNGLMVAPEKSSVVIFIRNGYIPRHCLIPADNKVIQFKALIRFLGMTLDSKLTCTSHVKTLIETNEQTLNIIRSLTTTWWGAHASVLLLLCHSFIKSRLD